IFKPALGRIVIMGSSIDDGMGRKVVRSMTICFRRSTKGKLQNTHPWKPKLIAERGDLRGNSTQIFGNNRQRSALFHHGFEELCARARTPPPADRSWLIRQNFPITGKPNEMIKPHRIDFFKEELDAPNPPFIACSRMCFPIIKRASPTL